MSERHPSQSEKKTSFEENKKVDLVCICSSVWPVGINEIYDGPFWLQMSPRTKGKVIAVATPFSWLAQCTAGYSEGHVFKTLLSEPKKFEHRC